jgi:HSP20 family protein
MTEPTPTSPETVDKQPTPASAPTAAQAGSDGETRSFKPAETAARKAAETGRAAAQAAGEAGHRMADMGRQSSSEMAEFWRSSVESLTAMQMDLRHVFDEAWRRATSAGLRAPMMTAHPFAARMPSFLGQPAADVREGEDAYRLSIELPGLTREDIDLSLRDNLITIRGHKAEDAEQVSGPYHLSERRFGRFERSFAIPQDVDRTRIEASFENGLLKVVMPRSVEASKQAWKIEVKGT